MELRARALPQQVNVRALVAIALIVVWSAVLLATGVFDLAHETPPSQFDYDAGTVPPTADDRRTATGQAAALIASLPVAVLALGIAASSRRVWREQVSAIIATSLASLASLAALASSTLAWIGVGTVIFFT